MTLSPLVPFKRQMSLRDRARLNICIAKDLAENFGGNKSVYLKKLNQKLKAHKAGGSDLHSSQPAKVA